MIDRYRGEPPWSVSSDVFPMSEKHSSVKPPSLQTRERGDLPRRSGSDMGLDISGGAATYTRRYIRGELLSGKEERRRPQRSSRTANIPLLRKKANRQPRFNDRCQALIIASQDESETRTLRNTNCESEDVRVSYIGKYGGISSEDLQIERQTRER